MIDSPIERWLPVLGYEGEYEVSDTGLVRSLDRVLTDGKRWKGQMMKIDVDDIGRPWVRLRRNNKSVHRRICTLVLESFVGPRPPGMDCCHNDGDPGNNVPENLRWDTRGNNMRDAVRHGTHHWAKKTHCKWGHEFTPENTRPWKRADGGTGRACRTCNAGRWERDRQRRECGRVSA